MSIVNERGKGVKKKEAVYTFCYVCMLVVEMHFCTFWSTQKKTDTEKKFFQILVRNFHLKTSIILYLCMSFGREEIKIVKFVFNVKIPKFRILQQIFASLIKSNKIGKITKFSSRAILFFWKILAKSENAKTPNFGMIFSDFNNFCYFKHK